LIDIIEFESPYRQCYYFKNDIWLRYIAIANTMNLLIYFGLYAILNKMNLLSLLYWISMFYIIRKNFKPNIFKPNHSSGNIQNQSSVTNYNLKAQYGSAKNQSIILLVKIQLALISFMIIL
jgi:hypothetical protein